MNCIPSISICNIFLFEGGTVFTCQDGEQIVQTSVCDGTANCMNGEDEQGCGRFYEGNGGLGS